MSEKQNPMNKIEIEKVVLSVGGTAEDLEKGVKLLQFLTGKKPMRTKARKRAFSSAYSREMTSACRRIGLRSNSTRRISTR